MKTRKVPRTHDEISSYIKTIKTVARPNMTHIHLHRCDFDKVAIIPGRFDCTKTPDGRIVTVFNKKLIEVVAVND